MSWSAETIVPDTNFVAGSDLVFGSVAALRERSPANRVTRTRAPRSWLFLLLMAAGCFDSRPCEPERCDGRDNDCDRRVDEDFLTAGLYAEAEHCGACGLACDDVFPTAEATRCAVRSGRAVCELVRCPEGESLAGTGACEPEVAVACLPCVSDAECALRSSGARCVTDALGGGHCAPGCTSTRRCPTGFRCQQLDVGAGSYCVPASGACACDASMEGAELGCSLRAPGSESITCAGVQRCEDAALGACEPALSEVCNGADDDCDGSNDEGFVDPEGRYASLVHCGACGAPCAAPGPNMTARCEPAGDSAECVRECVDGFVDVDGFAANGCECELLEEERPRASADRDCDGEIDPTPELVFVSQAGDDASDGSSARSPVRSLARGLTLGVERGHPVLVARGVYSGPIAITSAVTIIGGYSPDFVAHDPSLYPTLIEGGAALEGAPVLRCIGVDAPARIEDLTIEASAADAPGQGSTAVLLDGCGPDVVLERVTILAARAAPGRAGRDSSAALPDIGLRSLAELAGSAGAVGAPGGRIVSGCPDVVGGAGGSKVCPSGDVSGGRGGDARCSVLDCENGSGIPCGNAGCTDFTVDGQCDIEAVRAAATPNPAPDGGRGEAPGAGGVASYDAPTNHGVCTFCDDNPSLPRLGDDGGDGRTGLDGAGGVSCDLAAWSIDAEGRVSAASGGDGGGGADGSGGGGGSAGAGFSRIRNTRGSCESVPGGAGGGGGSGGCGAPGAGGGGGGGGSVGVLIRLAAGAERGPTLRDVRIVTASGGGGGDGGGGASGGVGGNGGLGGGSEFWCARGGGRGGDGGRGGAGGGGAGGCGGPSLGVLLAGGGGVAAPAYLEALRARLRVELAGAAGQGGRAGFSPGQSGGTGRAGMRADVHVE